MALSIDLLLCFHCVHGISVAWECESHKYLEIQLGWDNRDSLSMEIDKGYLISVSQNPPYSSGNVYTKSRFHVRFCYHTGRIYGESNKLNEGTTAHNSRYHHFCKMIPHIINTYVSDFLRPLAASSPVGLLFVK